VDGLNEKCQQNRCYNRLQYFERRLLLGSSHPKTRYDGSEVRLNHVQIVFEDCCQDAASDLGFGWFLVGFCWFLFFFKHGFQKCDPFQYLAADARGYDFKKFNVGANLQILRSWLGWSTVSRDEAV
jgi:hypothetical protein